MFNFAKKKNKKQEQLPTWQAGVLSAAGMGFVSSIFQTAYNNSHEYKSRSHGYNASPFETLKTIPILYQIKGPRGLLKGYWTNCINEVAFSAAASGIYNYERKLFYQKYPKHFMTKDLFKIGYISGSVGFVSATKAALLTFPMTELIHQKRKGKKLDLHTVVKNSVQRSIKQIPKFAFQSAMRQVLRSAAQKLMKNMHKGLL
ncbi:substrate carrier family protein e [Anaeramoeba flamelloides]|uniref:Substrate carrier family protein e n=1 Tax=Anaeramoeba flamelloides TaxID=1746091 RepID=A0AAV7YEZ4_9EUKA|nr:substrate carrier family protein e [Anaeramoeba flamelloides]